MNTATENRDNQAALVTMIRTYLADSGKSARWLGLRVCGDARMVPNLARGQAYPAAALLRLSERLCAFYSDRLADEAGLFADDPHALPLAA